MIVNIKCFGRIAEIAGFDNKVLNIDAESLDTLIKALSISTPELEFEVYAIFVNNKKAENYDIGLKENDEIYLMPPFAGG